MSGLVIGVDTNILIRLLTKDEPLQFEKAAELVASATSASPLVVNLVAMIETLWVLEKSYSISGLDAKKTVSSLLACPEFSFSTRNPLAGWSEIMTSSHPDITDLVIAGVNTELGCTLTYTFDRRAARNVPGMVLLT